MQLVEGYVCRARIRSNNPTLNLREELLFGPTTTTSDWSHQNFETNGLTPYKSLAEAIEGLNELKERKNLLDRFGVAYINLQIATSEKETALFQKENNLILVATLNHNYKYLLGKRIEGTEGVAYAPISALKLNGYTPIENYDQAYRAGCEINRQGRPVGPAQMAAFKFKRLKIPEYTLPMF